MSTVVLTPLHVTGKKKPAASLCEALEKAGVTAAEIRVAGYGVSMVTDKGAVHSTEEEPSLPTSHGDFKAFGEGERPVASNA